MRKEFAEAADQAELDQPQDLGVEDQQVENAKKKVRARGPGEGSSSQSLPLTDLKDPTPIGSRKRSRRHGALSLSQKIQIVYQVLCRKDRQADVAKEYRITLSYVSLLVNRALKNKTFIDEMVGLREAKD